MCASQCKKFTGLCRRESFCFFSEVSTDEYTLSIIASCKRALGIDSWVNVENRMSLVVTRSFGFATERNGDDADKKIPTVKKECSELVGNFLAEFGGRCRKAMLGVGFERSPTTVLFQREKRKKKKAHLQRQNQLTATKLPLVFCSCKTRSKFASSKATHIVVKASGLLFWICKK